MNLCTKGNSHCDHGFIPSNFNYSHLSYSSRNKSSPIMLFTTADQYNQGSNTMQKLMQTVGVSL